MSNKLSPGARFRKALKDNQPLQMDGTSNAYAAMMAEKVGPGDAVFTTPFTFFATAEPGSEGDAPTHTHPIMPVYSRNSIAVLPCVHLINCQTHAYLGDVFAG